MPLTVETIEKEMLLALQEKLTKELLEFGEQYKTCIKNLLKKSRAGKLGKIEKVNNKNIIWYIDKFSNEFLIPHDSQFLEYAKKLARDDPRLLCVWNINGLVITLKE
jgi:hypothetical protein